MRLKVPVYMKVQRKYNKNTRDHQAVLIIVDKQLGEHGGLVVGLVSMDNF